MDTRNEWLAELAWIVAAADTGGRVRECNRDPACFCRYCDMQARAALRAGFQDIADSIRTAAQWVTL